MNRLRRRTEPQRPFEPEQTSSGTEQAFAGAVAALTHHGLRQIDTCMIVGIPRDDRIRKDRVAVRLAPQGGTVAAASPDCSLAHEGEEIEAAVDGICIANSPEEEVAAPKDVEPNGFGTQITGGFADLYRQEICRSPVPYSGPGGRLLLAMQLQFCRLVRRSSPRCY
ncbi:hypothetical protein PQR75_44445 [Paraburkholderia fungorum]|uniref:hypothetical protein n=1 Tax=Paraburkholderia TaxID=1822464 RepID=UPI0038B754D7